MGGRSNITFLGRDVDSTKADAYGNENSNGRPRFGNGVAAASYEHRLSDRTLARLVLSGSRATQRYDEDTVLYATGRRVRAEIPRFATDLTQEKLSANLTVAHKFSARDRISGGVIVDLLRYDYRTATSYPRPRTLRDASGTTALAQLYGQWKHRFTDQLTLNAGVNALHFALNGRTVVEPRLGVQYQATPGSTLSLACGLHSALQSLPTYFTQTRLAGNSYAPLNRDMGFTRSHHLVLAYDRQLSENLRLRVEGYQQWVFDAPVERTPSAYSNLTDGVSFVASDKGNLINNGTGRNYGLELTLERAFAQGYYFLLTGSLFESNYKGSDGVARNTPFNTHYAANALVGREFRLDSRGNTFTLSLKSTVTGGRYVTPLNLDESRATGRAVYQFERAFSEQQPRYFRADVKLGYKINRARLTHEIAFDLQNITNNKNIFQQAYNPRTNQLGTAYQQGFLPVPFYRLTF